MKRRLAAELVQAMLEMRDNGQSYDDISFWLDRQGVKANRETVRRWCKELGLPTGYQMPGSRPAWATHDHGLYRLYDADGRLLYVGCTCNLGGRLKQHARDKAWFSDIATLTWEPIHGDVYKAEREAIAAERPLHNKIYAKATA